jgi:nucleoside-diphosphate-sugar epimerase
MLAVPAWKIGMARVLITGASKGIGFETTLQALEAGHQVRALARSAASIGLSDPKLEKVRGDALISKDIEAALNGIEVVIQTLGVSMGDLFRSVNLFSHATRVLVSAMESQGVKRLICVTGFGAGDSCALYPLAGGGRRIRRGAFWLRGRDAARPARAGAAAADRRRRFPL